MPPLILPSVNEFTPTDQEIFSKGKEILDVADAQQKLPEVIDPNVWCGRFMEWSMGHEALKAQTLRFVDVLASLSNNHTIVAHLNEYFGGHEANLAQPLRWAVGLSQVAPALVGRAVKSGVSTMARQFIIGTTGAAAVPVLKRRWNKGIGFTVDILGEAVVSEREAEEYYARYLELIESLAKESTCWKRNPAFETPGDNPIPRVNVSVKISALYSQIHIADPDKAIAKLKQRLLPLFLRAKELGVFVNLDMEHYGLKDLTLRLFRSLLDEPQLADYPHVGLVIQAYLRDSVHDFEEMLEWAKSRKRKIAIRLVKGAYWDYETIIAQQKEWPIPVYTQKPESDLNYERIARLMLENHEHIYSAFGTHNVRSMAYAITTAEKFGLKPHAYEIQMLYGMAETIKTALIRMGHRVREYSPVGEMLPGMAYLVRRLLENNSNEGFLKAKFSSRVPSKILLQDPQTALQEAASFTFMKDIPSATAPTSTFENAAPLDFNIEKNRIQMQEALVQERSRFGTRYPAVIGEEQILHADEWIESVNPANPSEIVGLVPRATVAQAEKAVEVASHAAAAWRLTPVEVRARILERMAQIMESERFRLAALEVYEVGKPWLEADGDIIEAMDFCRYYATEMRRLDQPERTAIVPGESSLSSYLPRGVALVIAPWNFPLAILCGMTVAALVAGNTVIMKPAEQSSVIAAQLMRIATQAGVPAGVLNLVTGYGEDVGEYLVNHPKIDLITFTGSREVGLKIWEAAGRTHPGQAQLKHVVCEMGGKNAMIIDSDADLDEAVIGAVYSAFGFQGQKCSALSRLIVLEECYDRMVERFIEATSCIQVGLPADPSTIVGPVIDQNAQERIQSYIEIGKTEARLAYTAKLSHDTSLGYFIPPTIFVDVKPSDRIAREEIFGPVISILKAKDLSHAIAIANDTEYALTGGIYSRSPANIDRVKREMLVGNLYINRSITGAIVKRHPFGGFKMSGGGTKAGGKDYLLNFLIPRVITENCLRRGFAPAEEL